MSLQLASIGRPAHHCRGRPTHPVLSECPRVDYVVGSQSARGAVAERGWLLPCPGGGLFWPLLLLLLVSRGRLCHACVRRLFENLCFDACAPGAKRRSALLHAHPPMLPRTTARAPAAPDARPAAVSGSWCADEPSRPSGSGSATSVRSSRGPNSGARLGHCAPELF